MKRIIQVQTLFDNYHNMEFGYVGVDIDTGVRYYLSFYDEEDKWDYNHLHFLDPTNPSAQIARHLFHCNYSFERFSKDIHLELAKLVEETILEHRKYNEKNGYPNEMLDFNRKHLKVIYVSEDSIFAEEEKAAIYIPVNNEVELSYSSYDYEKASAKEKNKIKLTVIHEVGHMKVSKGKIVDNQLLIKIGFYPSTFTLEPITMSNGDIFYKIPKSPNGRINLEKRALEEIINDTDCTLLFPTFERSYPNIGDSLNKLCDGILPHLRSEDEAFEAYSDYLKKITKSKDMVDEINGLIKDALYGRNQRKDKLKALKLIRSCQDRKNINA